jgi:hypothetical protein
VCGNILKVDSSEFVNVQAYAVSIICDTGCKLVYSGNNTWAPFIACIFVFFTCVVSQETPGHVDSW